MVYKQLGGMIQKLMREKKDPFPDIFGQETTKKEVLSAIMAGRHVIIVGYPGVGKTTLAKDVAALLPDIPVVEGCPFNCDPENPVCPACIEKKQNKEKQGKKNSPGLKRFIRVQGSPDLQVEDLLGDIDPIKALKYGPTSHMAFTPGKLLRANRGVLFFDEINRCPERLQNALLQVVEEGKATIGGYEIDYPSNFVMIATMNPAECVGTERLSEVLMDRFDHIDMFYPETAEIEKKIIVAKSEKIDVGVPNDVLDFIVEIVRSTRGNEKIEKPAGVRASIGLYERAKTTALIDGRKTVTIDDVKSVVRSVLRHRITLAAKIRHSTSPEEVISELVKKAEGMVKKKSSMNR